MEAGVWRSRSEAEKTTVAALLDRYAREVLSQQKGGDRELSRIRLLSEHLGQYSLLALSSSMIAQYRDMRLASISRRGTITSPQTVKHELSLLTRALKKGQHEWGMTLPAGLPTALVKMPKLPQARDRRLQGDEESRLLAECANAQNTWLLPVVRFAIETAMRAGEIVETKGKTDENGERPIQSTGLLWKHVDLNRRVALLPETKNGTARTVPLSSTAVDVLRGLPRSLDGKVFGATYEAIHLSFARACKRAS